MIDDGNELAPPTPLVSQPVSLDRPFPFWTFGDVVLFLGLAIPCFVMGFFATAFVAKAIAGTRAPEGLVMLIGQFVGYVAAAVALWLLFRVRYDAGLRETLEWRLERREILPAVNAGLGLAIGILILGAILQTPQMDSPMEKLLSDPVSLAAAAVLGVTLGPIFEEAFFRGLLQPLVVKVGGVAVGILMPAALFGLLHGQQYGWSWRHIVLVSAAGAAFGWKRQRARSVAAAALMHSTYNLFLFAGLIFGRNMTEGK